MTDTPAERQRFRVLIMGLATALNYRDKVDTPYLRVMWNGLDDVPIEVLEQSVKAVTQRHRFMPSVAEWRALLDTLPLPEALGLLPPVEGCGVVKLYCTACNDAGYVLYETERKVYAKRCTACEGRNPARQSRVRYGRERQEA